MKLSYIQRLLLSHITFTKFVRYFMFLLFSFFLNVCINILSLVIFFDYIIIFRFYHWFGEKFLASFISRFYTKKKHTHDIFTR